MTRYNVNAKLLLLQEQEGFVSLNSLKIVDLQRRRSRHGIFLLAKRFRSKTVDSDIVLPEELYMDIDHFLCETTGIIELQQDISRESYLLLVVTTLQASGSRLAAVSLQKKSVTVHCSA